MRLDSPQTSRSTSSSPTPIQSKAILTNDEKSIKIEEDSEATDIEDENTDAGEFAVEMGLACVICKQIDFAPNNQLVECQECHNLYHQECHKPALIDHDVSDPRFVWYCAKCQKTLKKIAVKPNKGNNKSPVQTPTSTPNVSQLKEFSTQGIKTPVKGENHSDSRLIQPFKRVEPKASVSNNSFLSSVSSSSSAKPIGLAALANISRSSSVSSNTAVIAKSKNGSNGSSTSSLTSTTTTSLLTNSEKRLQNFKKSKSGRQK
jgi:integrator complex subunit 12